MQDEKVPLKTEDLRKIMDFAGGGESMGAVASIFQLVRHKNGLNGATGWLEKRGFPVNGSQKEKTDWWNTNIERYFTHEQGKPMQLKRKYFD